MADLITNLQSIYNTKLQIKSAIGTDSDVFSDYPAYISDLKPSGYTYITTNGDHNVNAYSYVNVNVPVPPGYIIPEGTYTATSNGVHDITSYSNVDVQVSSAAVLGNLSVTENGQYSASTYAYDGFDVVDVNVPTVTPVLNSLSVYANGVYTPQTGVDGFNEVTVNVPTGGSSIHDGLTPYTAFTVDELISYMNENYNPGDPQTANALYVKGKIANVIYTFSAQYPSWRGYLTNDGTFYYETENPSNYDLSKDLYVYGCFWESTQSQLWDSSVTPQVAVGDEVIILAPVAINSNGRVGTQNGYLYSHQKPVTGQLTITQSGTYDVQGYVSVVVDLTPTPAYITNIQYSTGNTDGGVSSQVGDNWTDMTEDPVTGVFSTPASDSTHYNGNNSGGYIAFRTVYSDNSYTYLNVPHGYNNSIQYNTSGACTEENALVYFTWNDTFTTNYIEINKNDLYFNVHRTPWVLTSYKCSYNSSTGQYDVIDPNATPGTINNMTAKLSGFENSYFYKFACTVGYDGRIIQNNIFATEQVTLQDNDYAVTLDTAGSYYLTFNSTQIDDRMLSVTFNGAESFNSISASWQEAPFIRISYTSGGTSQSLKLKADVAGTLTIDSQQVISVYDKNGERWISSDGATCNSSSSGQSISLTQDMEMTAQDSNVTFDAGQYSIVPTINGDSFMIYSVGLTVSYIGANS